MTHDFERPQEIPTDAEQEYYRRGARGEGNSENGFRGHDIGLREEHAYIISRMSAR